MLNIRPATSDDAYLLKTLIHELAVYDKLEAETIVTEEDVLRDGFGAHPKFRALIAEWEGQVAGYALFFEFYSSFQGRAGLFLEDIFVRPPLRKKGIGTELLARVAKIAWDEEYFCLRWEVLRLPGGTGRPRRRARAAQARPARRWRAARYPAARR